MLQVMPVPKVAKETFCRLAEKLFTSYMTIPTLKHGVIAEKLIFRLIHVIYLQNTNKYQPKYSTFLFLISTKLFHFL